MQRGLNEYCPNIISTDIRFYTSLQIWLHYYLFLHRMKQNYLFDKEKEKKYLQMVKNILINKAQSNYVKFVLGRL